MDILISILGFVLTLFIIISVHELGHFLMARALGIKVLCFSLGFGKKIISIKDKRQTEFILSMIPLGGYVKMLDEHEGPVDTKDLNRAYNRQSLLKRFAVIAAGPLMNFILAFVLYWVFFMVGFTSISPVIGKVTPHSIAEQAHLKPNQEIISLDNSKTLTWMSVIIHLLTNFGDNKDISIEVKNPHAQHTEHLKLNLADWKLNELNPDPLLSIGIIPFYPKITPVITEIHKNSPAKNSNLKVNDTILQIDSHKITDWPQVISIIQHSPAKTLLFTVNRDSKIISFPVEIARQKEFLHSAQGYLGIGTKVQWPPSQIRYNKYNMFTALPLAGNHTWDFIKLNILLLGKMVTGKVSVKSLGGPISIFDNAGTSLHMGFSTFISFLAFISIAIGVVNIVPIPGLDGGHILLLIMEGIRGKTLSVKLTNLLYRLGLIFLFLLLIQSLVNDLMRLN